MGRAAVIFIALGLMHCGLAKDASQVSVRSNDAGTDLDGTACDGAADCAEDAPGCEDDGDCPTDALAHLAGSCVSGSCEYRTCEPGWARDADGAICDRKCLAEENPCTAVDDDCDGVALGLPPDCSETAEGLCASARPRCEGETFVGCGPALFSEIPEYSGATELFRCDRVDNNCDGVVDEQCCPVSEIPGEVIVAPNGATLSDLAAYQSATFPSAAFVAAWVELDVARVQRLTALGRPVGPQLTFPPPAQQSFGSLSITTIISGQPRDRATDTFLAVTAGNTVFVHEIADDATTVSAEITSSAAEVRNVEIAINDVEVCLVYAENAAGWRIAHQCRFRSDLDTAATSGLLADLDDAEPSAPNIARGEGRLFRVAWTRPSTLGNHTFYLANLIQGIAQDQTIGIPLWTDAGYRPGLVRVGNQLVAAVRKTADQTAGTEELYAELPGAFRSVLDIEPSLVAFDAASTDRDFDGEVDGATAVWFGRLGMVSSPVHRLEIIAGAQRPRFALGGAVGVRRSSVAATDKVVGVIWETAIRGIHFATVSHQGPAICMEP